MISKLFNLLFMRREMPKTDFSTWEIKPYMKTPNVVAMDMKSFYKSKEVKSQCRSAMRLAEEGK